MISTYLVSLASLAVLASSTIQDVTTTTSVPISPGDTEPTVMFDNTLFGFDAARVFNSNNTTWDWWYFDAVSASSKASVVVVFYAADQAGFPFTSLKNFTRASITATLPDGRLIDIPVASNGVTITTKRGNNDVIGDWTDSGFSFKGENNMKTYVVTIDSPEVGVTGELVLHSAAPPQFPCLADYPDILIPQDTQIIPGIGWANAMPDARAMANFTLKDTNGTATSLDFSDGVGYHDKNWGSVPFQDATKGWYWGHARLGAYSVVWFNALDWQDTEHVSGYVTRDGQVLSAGCAAASVKVRPLGDGVAWPPTANSTHPTGFEMFFALPESEGGSLKAVATPGGPGWIADGIGRWPGKVTGILANGTALEEGAGFWEEFNIPAFQAAARTPE